MDDYPYATLGADGWFRCDGMHSPGFPTLLRDVLHRFGYTGLPAYCGRLYRQFGLGRCKVHMDIPAHPTDPTMTAWFTTARGDDLDDTLERTATQGHAAHPPSGPPKVAGTKTSRVNYTTMEDVLEGEQVLVGTFSLNGHPVTVLFDSGASHDFITKACTQRCQLNIHHLDTPYLISTPGGRIVTKQTVRHAPLNLAGKLYKPSLILLDGRGLDVILGMGWMKAHWVILDTATRVVQMDSPVHGDQVLQLSTISAATPLVQHTVAQNLEDISVASEFPDVFPEDLPGMPPDRDVEFIIEL
jgi:hypothetical protein